MTVPAGRVEVQKAATLLMNSQGGTMEPKAESVGLADLNFRVAVP